MSGTLRRKSLRGIVLAATVLATLFTAAPSNAEVDATASPKICLPVYLTATGGPGEPDPVLINTVSKVYLGRIQIATTAASFTPAGVVGNSLAFTGPIVFTPKSSASTLTANVRGKVNVNSGDFLATTTSVTGTGVMTGVSGSLVFVGNQAPSGSFTETITGTLCARGRLW